MRQLFIGMIGLFTGMSSALAAPMIEIESAAAFIEGARGIGFEVTLKYNGNERMDSRLISGRYLQPTDLISTFMDRDLVIDDPLEFDGAPETSWSPKLMRASDTDKTPRYWDVKANPSITLRRVYDVTKGTFRKPTESLFRHELISGKPSWYGRLYRVNRPEWGESSYKDEHPLAGLVVADVAHWLARLVPWIVQESAKSVVGQRSDAAEFFGEAELYFLADLRFQDALAYNYRVRFETTPMQLPEDLGTVDVGNGTLDTQYQELGVQTAPGFNDLSD